ncbi:hypothetical protein ACCW76_17630 [Pantoea sp. C8B4]|uniref:hypothetical protein n=1 Tax=Pantoea sp. C8B4 TaxID=3243083 RepID=UPI003ED8A9B8
MISKGFWGEIRTIFQYWLKDSKMNPVPKIALWRRGVKGEEADLLDGYVIALASDEKLTIGCLIPDINQPVIVSYFIENWLKKGR